MDRRSFLAATAGGLSVGATSVAEAQDVKQFRLRMQRYYGTETDTQHAAFAENLKIASDGRLQISMFRGGELIPNDQIVDAVGTGIIEIGHGYSGYWPGKMDIAQIESGVPGAWINLEEAHYIWYEKGLLQLVREAYAEKGIHYVCPVFGGAFDLLTKKPVNSLDELRSLKIRATPAVATVLQHLGIPTVFIPAQEIYVAMSTGVIDGVIYGSPLEYKELKLYEVGRQYTYLNMLYPGYVDGILVNKAAWDRLPGDLQRQFELAAQQLAFDHHNWLSNGSRNAIAENIFDLATLSADDAKSLTQAAQKVWSDEAAKSERNKAAIQLLTDAAKASGRL